MTEQAKAGTDSDLLTSERGLLELAGAALLTLGLGTRSTLGKLALGGGWSGPGLPRRQGGEPGGPRPQD